MKKYVVQCICQISRRDAALGWRGVYHVGDYVTHSGAPNCNIDRAYVYDNETHWPGHDLVARGTEASLDFFFKKVYVRLVPIKRTLRRPTRVKNKHNV